MKKHVLLGLALMLCCFIAGGLYITTSIRGVTQKLEQVISFHQVEFLRKSLIHHIQAAQSNLLLQGSPHSIGFEPTVTLIEAMENSAEVCLSCHHSEETSQRLNRLIENVNSYMKLLSRSLTLRANNLHMENDRMAAFAEGKKLLKNVESVSTASAAKISERIARINQEINATNNFLIACLVLGPLAILIITNYFLKRFTGSVKTLVTAAQILEKGDLDFRLDAACLKDEFRILASSLNSMAVSLKNEQEKFQSVHQLYQTLFESAGDAIMITRLESEAFGIIVSANQASADLYGYSTDELIGMDIVTLIPIGKEERFRDHIRDVPSGKWSYQRVKRIKKDGSLIYVDISMGQLQIAEEKHLLSFCRDVTEQLQAEEKQQLVNQMIVCGQMAAGLAHEIKNPLAGVKVSLDVLADELVLPQEDKEIFARIINEINRMEKLLKNLLNYARPPRPQFDLVDMNRLLDNSLKNVELASNKDTNFSIHFDKSYAAFLPQIEVDSTQMQQVFLNIFLNAVDSMEAEGTITATTQMDGEDRILINISDNGKGISEAALEKIFTPFFTTKTKGNGLGLSICKRLVEQHDGSITVHSQPESGTSFTIVLPLTQKNRE
jgi:two-component system sensor histidine kinase AtoS